MALIISRCCREGPFDRTLNAPLSFVRTALRDEPFDRTLRALDAESEKAIAVIELYRGFNDTQVTDEFKKLGGSQAAPMSTSTDLLVSCGYAVRMGETNGGLLMKIITKNNLQRGADLTFLSMFPGEAETLFPPLTFVQPTGRVQVIEVKHGDRVFNLTVIEVTTTLP